MHNEILRAQPYCTRRQAAERPRASLLSGRSYGWSDGMDSAEEKLHFISLLMAVRTLSTVSLPSVIGLFPFPLTFAAWLSFWLEARDNAISSIRCLKGWEWFVRACMNICIACIGTFQSQCVCVQTYPHATQKVSHLSNVSKIAKGHYWYWYHDGLASRQSNQSMDQSTFLLLNPRS